LTSHDNRVSSETDVFRQAVGYGYDANSNRTQLGLGGATNASYQYDVINRLTQLTDSASLAFNFAYDATNKLTSRTTPNGTTATHQYDALDRLTRLTHTKAPTTIADFQYQFNGPLAAIVVIGGVVVAEALLHRYFARRAERFFPNEPFGRQKHCYVNCMSMRIHLGQRAWPAIFSIGQEIPPLMQGVLGGDSSGQVAESLGDLRADIYGQQSAFIIWKSCKELCTGCP
jgi:YD repeat-containing protein